MSSCSAMLGESGVVAVGLSEFVGEWASGGRVYISETQR
jgi:hypothetical protein